MKFSKKFRIPLSSEKLRRAVSKYGLKGSAEVLADRIHELVYDRWYGLDTVELVELEQLNLDEADQKAGNQYQPTGVRTIRKILRHLGKYKKTHLVDFGSGKGQVLIEADRMGYEHVEGVEFSGELHQIARSNLEILERRGKLKRMPRLLEMDARDYYPGEAINLFYFFNPFMGTVLDNILQSLHDHPREVILAYYYPLFKEEFEKRFEQVETTRIKGHDLIIYRWTPGSKNQTQV